MPCVPRGSFQWQQSDKVAQNLADNRLGSYPHRKGRNFLTESHRCLAAPQIGPLQSLIESHYAAQSVALTKMLECQCSWCPADSTIEVVWPTQDFQQYADLPRLRLRPSDWQRFRIAQSRVPTSRQWVEFPRTISVKTSSSLKAF